MLFTLFVFAYSGVQRILCFLSVFVLFPFDISVKRVNVIRKGVSSYLKTNADMEWVGDLVVL